MEFGFRGLLEVFKILEWNFWIKYLMSPCYFQCSSNSEKSGDDPKLQCYTANNNS